jgi:uncharacterized protein YuzE
MNRKERKGRKVEPISLSKKNVQLSYDEEADVLYLNFKKPSHADDSELMENDIIVRYESEDVVGVTVMNASKKLPTLRLHDLSTSMKTSEAFNTLLDNLSLFSEDFMNERVQPPIQKRSL